MLDVWAREYFDFYFYQGSQVQVQGKNETTGTILHSLKLTSSLLPFEFNQLFVLSKPIHKSTIVLYSTIRYNSICRIVFITTFNIM